MAQTVGQTLMVGTTTSAAAATNVYNALVKLNKDKLDEMREEQKKYQGDLDSIYSVGAKNIAKFMADSVGDQIRSLQQLQKEATATSATFVALEARVAAGGISALTSDQEQRDYLRGLQAKEGLLRAHEKNITEIQAAEKTKREGIQDKVGQAAGVLAGALDKTSTGPAPGDKTIQEMSSGISSIASSKTIWEGILNTSKLLLDLGVNIYMEGKRRTADQVAAAGGSLQLKRSMNDPAQLKAAAHTQLMLETDTHFTPKERGNMGAMMGTLQRGSQGKANLGNYEETKAVMEKIAVLGSNLGKSMEDMTAYVAESGRKTNRGGQEVVDALMRASAAVDAYNEKAPLEMISKQGFMDSLQQMTTSMKLHKFTEDDAAMVTAKWARQLDDGAISVGEIVQAMKGFTSAEMGTLTFLAPTIAKNVKGRANEVLGEESGSKLTAALDKETGLGLAQTIKMLGEGSKEAFQRLKLGTGDEKKDSELLKKIVGLMQEGSTGAVRTQTDKFTGGGSAGLSAFMEQNLGINFLKGKGVNAAGQSFDVLQEHMRGGGEWNKKQGEGPSFSQPGGAKVQTDTQQIAQDVKRMEGYLRSIRDLQNTWWDKAKANFTREMGAGAAQLGDVKDKHGTAAAAGLYATRFAEELIMTGPKALLSLATVAQSVVSPRSKPLDERVDLNVLSDQYKKRVLGYKPPSTDGFPASGNSSDVNVNVRADQSIAAAIPGMQRAIKEALAGDAQRAAAEAFQAARAANGGAPQSLPPGRP